MTDDYSMIEFVICPQCGNSSDFLNVKDFRGIDSFRVEKRVDNIRGSHRLHG